MKVGDLVHVIDDDNGCYSGQWCGCSFCNNNSSRIGVIIKKLGVRRDPLGNIHPPAATKFGGYWTVLFDFGDWRLYGIELEVISKNR